MPIYEYACKECDHVLDALQKMNDDPLTDCPECGKPALKRLLSAPRFRLKGKGWYETDFKTGDQRNVLKSESDSGSSSSKKTDKDTSSKSTAKPSTKTTSKTDKS